VVLRIDERALAETIHRCNAHLDKVMAKLEDPEAEEEFACLRLDSGQEVRIGEWVENGEVRLDRNGAGEIFNTIYAPAGLRTVAEDPPAEAIPGDGRCFPPAWWKPDFKRRTEQGMSLELARILSIWGYDKTRPRGSGLKTLRRRLNKRLTRARALCALQEADLVYASEEFLHAFRLLKEAMPGEQLLINGICEPRRNRSGNAKRMQPNSDLALLFRFLQTSLVREDLPEPHGLSVWGTVLFVVSIGESRGMTHEQLLRAVANANRPR
jgi:hypothetical protein